MTLTADQWSSLIASIGILIGAIAYALKKRANAAEAREKSAAEAHVLKTKAEAELVSARAAEQLARADVLRLEAESRKTAEENTGKFIAELGEDRAQIKLMVDELRATIARADARIKSLEAELESAEAKVVEANNRVAGAMQTIDALLEEIKLLRRAIDSGGAYLAPGAERR